MILYYIYLRGNKPDYDAIITTLAQSEEEAVDNVRRQIGSQACYFAAYAIDEDMADLITKERSLNNHVLSH